VHVWFQPGVQSVKPPSQDTGFVGPLRTQRTPQAVNVIEQTEPFVEENIANPVRVICGNRRMKHIREDGLPQRGRVCYKSR